MIDFYIEFFKLKNCFLWNYFFSWHLHFRWTVWWWKFLSLKLFFLLPDFFRPGPRHLVQPGQPDPSRGSDVEQPPSGRISRRFHSSDPGTFPGHFRNGVRVGDRGQVDVQIIIWEAFDSVKRHQTEANKCHLS